MREYIERLAALQTIDLRIQEMEREKRQLPQIITSLEEELKKEEDKWLFRNADFGMRNEMTKEAEGGGTFPELRSDPSPFLRSDLSRQFPAQKDVKGTGLRLRPEPV